jgi:hypothetical protein
MTEEKIPDLSSLAEMLNGIKQQAEEFSSEKIVSSLLEHLIPSGTNNSKSALSLLMSPDNQLSGISTPYNPTPQEADRASAAMQKLANQMRRKMSKARKKGKLS